MRVRERSLLREYFSLIKEVEKAVNKDGFF